MIAKTTLTGLAPAAVVTSLTVHPDGVVRAGLDRELPLMTDVYITPPAQPVPVQEPVAGKGKELSEQLKLCARNVAFVAAGSVDMGSAAMQEMFALIDHVCIGLDSPPAAQRQWVGLTDDEIDSVQHQYIQQMMPGSRHFARAIEDKLREKNS